uniref:Retroviral polymerase SH3-like domain-containing protein n=1 Tax=Solanum lycopersicum TaxID=4081 RepID=A0A3Q7HCN8_SOLLC
MTGNFLSLYDITSVPKCSIGLPDGTRVVENSYGSVQISNNLTLHNDHVLTTEIGRGTARNGVYVFQSQAFVSASRANQVELLHKGLGYASGTKGWRVYDLETHRFFHTRDISFDETTFPFASTHTNQQPKTSKPPVHQADFPNNIVVPTPSTNSNTSFNSLPHSSTPQQSSPTPIVPPIDSSTSQQPTPTMLPIDSSPPIDQRDISPNPPPARASSRVRHPPSYLSEYVCQSATNVPSVTCPTTSPRSGTRFPITNYVHYDKLHDRYRGFLAALSTTDIPRSFRDAIKFANWREAMQIEIRALENNQTGVLTYLLAGRRALGCQWVYKTKYHADGSKERDKARLFPEWELYEFFCQLSLPRIGKFTNWM